jgi:hypothetical protein
MTKENIAEIMKGVLAIIIVAGALVSLFYPGMGDTGGRILQSLATLVIGFYFGTNKEMITGTLFGSKKKTKK